MKEKNWYILLGIVLILLSLTLYSLHYMIFHDAHHIFIYTLGDIAFIPIEVLIITLIVHKLLERRDTRMKLEKLNMVIGTFFSAVGTPLLTYLSDNDPHLDEIRNDLVISDNWSNEEFIHVNNRLKRYSYDVNINTIDLAGMKQFLTEKESFLIRLLENPMILEHGSFTELLRAVFHLTEELEKRPVVTGLPESDLKHLSGDIRRVYVLLVHQWLGYMEYLKGNYPYLFSLAMRTNPFDQQASAIVT